MGSLWAQLLLQFYTKVFYTKVFESFQLFCYGLKMCMCFWDYPPIIFSWHGRSPGRAVALTLASASTFTLKFFKSLYFPDHLIDLVHIWCDDRYSSKVLFSSTPAHYLKVRAMDLEIFNVKVF